MSNTTKKRRIAVAVGRLGEWVVFTPDGQAHRGTTRAEAMTTAIYSEQARAAQVAIAATCAP